LTADTLSFSLFGKDKFQMKKFFLCLIALVLVFAVMVQMGMLSKYGIDPYFKINIPDRLGGENADFETVGDVRYRSRVNGNNFEFYQNGRWRAVFVTGVNIGATEPGLFPGDLSISYEDYYRWFQMISDMNVNCIRVYTTMRPQFYNALLDFNSKSNNTLWLFQGVWMDEADINAFGDVFAQNEKIALDFISDAKNAVDVIHGNITLPERAGFASGEYTADVSKYLAGWILGIEPDPKLVLGTNQNNTGKTEYAGKYMYTLSASPFEVFLCRAGDAVIEYQTEKYGIQVPIAFTNWVTTDPLSHPNEPHEDEDLVTVNVENIKARDTYYPGQFACYHVYPYYPDSLSYQEDYIDYTDPYGKKNPYRAYLRDLKLAHTMPILVGEFGIPTSRGKAHESIMGYNQGGVDETRQGEMLLDMFRSMYEEDYAGGLIFMWQDEWFKRTWNNEKFDLADKRPFWSNVQTNEQFFGILAFDPGKSQAICHVDGKTDDWEGASPVLVSSAGNLYMKSDERYVYFMLQCENYDFEKDTLLIPIDTIEGQGNFQIRGTGVTFDKAADFVIQINGRDNSRIMVDSYYDSFYFLYGEQYRMIPLVSDIRTKNSGRFNRMMMCINYELVIPPSNRVIPFGQFETGKLAFGISDPKSSEYKSLSDFYFKDGILELRIPWQLLNVMDPSDKKIMDDIYKNQVITPADAGSWWVGACVEKGGTQISLKGSFTWKKWVMPSYHERLKPAYYVLKEGLKEFRK